jgi:hypothetical protein
MPAAKTGANTGMYEEERDRDKHIVHRLSHLNDWEGKSIYTIILELLLTYPHIR